MASNKQVAQTKEKPPKPSRVPYGSIVKRFHSPEARQELSRRLIEHLKSGKHLNDFREVNKRSLQQLMIIHKEDFDIETIKKFLSTEGSRIGSTSSEKFDTSEKRKEVFKKFCEHVSKGYTRHSFPDASFETIRKYLNLYPEDMEMELLEAADRVSRLAHENIGLGLSTGKVRGSTAAWKFIMVNRFEYKADENVTINNNNQENIQQTHVQIYIPDNKRGNTGNMIEQ